MAQANCLKGVRLAVATDRVAGAICADLLQFLGAETAADRCADILLAKPGAILGSNGQSAIRCDISAVGSQGLSELPEDAPDSMLQAWGGLMAATGDAGGAPRFINLPILDIFAGINAATASLAALRLVEAGHAARHIDIAVIDANASLLGTFLAHVLAGKKSGFRDGCRHPICAPWNAYAALDGYVMICSSTDLQWQRLVKLIGAAEDARLDTISGRVHLVEIVDAMVGGWTSDRTVAEAVGMLSAIGVPAGPIVNNGEAAVRDLAPFRLKPGPKGVKDEQCVGPLPLSGIKVLEIGPFTAGPLAGRLMADLGADVIKIEPPGGEVARGWSPRFAGASGYFSNYNAGKRSIALDLANAEDRVIFDGLLGAADVLVQNLKTGALEKFGFGADTMLQRNRGLVYCSISGYGADGSNDPALDTVVQARSGIMGLVEQGERPCKVGFSVADLIAAHLAPLAVIAALRHRKQTGEGALIDLSMLHALVWATNSSCEAGAVGAHRIEVEDGWIVAIGNQQSSTPQERHHLSQSAESTIESLQKSGIKATRVRDLGEVISDEILLRRRMFKWIAADGRQPFGVIGAPYGLEVTSSRVGDMIGGCDSGRKAVLQEWLPDRSFIPEVLK